MISFSGGRTSGYMLRKVLDAGLDADVHVLYANTGKEREETLDFIYEVETVWGVPIHWLERGPEGKVVEVDYGSASRDGEPFVRLIRKRNFLPNPIMRFCTSELKIRVMKQWMLAQGYKHWTNVVGIRHDEPRRVSRLLAPNKDRWEVALPLHDAKVTEPDVMAFWAAQPFDLRLRQDEGNCDLCFLKGRSKREYLIRKRPESADWWIEQEEAMGATFRINTPSYRKLREQVLASPMLFPVDPSDPTDLGDCVCHD